MLVFDPKKQITATEALAYEYLAPYHNLTNEPIADKKFNWRYNDANLPEETWKILMFVLKLYIIYLLRTYCILGIWRY